MAKAEPQFDVNRVSWMNLRYPSDRRIKYEIVKREAQVFEEKIRRDLCAIRELNVGRSYQMK